MWVKICGIRSLPIAESLVALPDASRPDALGLNFFAKSKRVIDVNLAAEIVRLCLDRVEPVGLFVNHARDEVLETVAATGLKTLQLHGDESVEFIAELVDSHPDLNIIRAFRVADQISLEQAAGQIKELSALKPRSLRIIVDSYVAGEYGGTGHQAPWELLKQFWAPEMPPLILAGGLTPMNVANGIRQSGATGVDTASGVEISPGLQDLEQVKKFVTEARLANPQQ